MAVRLYDDEPVKICGYASVFGVTYQLGGVLERIVPGAFDLTRHEVHALFAHEGDWRVGWTRDQSLKVWQDSVGLAFQLDVPATHHGLSLVQGIRANNFRACSFGADVDHTLISDFAVENDREVRVIRRIAVVEVSVCAIGANPETTCWMDTEAPEDLPPHVRHARAQWLKGRVAVQLAGRAARAARAQARAQARARVAPSDRLVDRIAAGWRPRGWARDLEAFAREHRR
jgi:HK97 family phage prohead protease